MKPALLVIDLQRWFLEVGPPEKLARVAALLQNANALIDSFRERSLPIVRVQTIHKADGSTWNLWMKEHQSPRLLEGSREAEEHPSLHAGPGDVVVVKTRHSAFIRTALDEILRERAVDTVVIAGFSTNACVGLTAIEAFERDFHVLLAGDAILGTDPERGRRMLDYLSHQFGIEPVSNREIAAMLSG